MLLGLDESKLPPVASCAPSFVIAAARDRSTPFLSASHLPSKPAVDAGRCLVCIGLIKTNPRQRRDQHWGMFAIQMSSASAQSSDPSRTAESEQLLPQPTDMPYCPPITCKGTQLLSAWVLRVPLKQSLGLLLGPQSVCWQQTNYRIDQKSLFWWHPPDRQRCTVVGAAGTAGFDHSFAAGTAHLAVSLQQHFPALVSLSVG